MHYYLTKLPRYIKAIIIILLDSMLISLAYFAAFSLRLSMPFPVIWYSNSFGLVIFSILIGLVLTFVMGLNRIKLSTFDSSAQVLTVIWIFLIAGISTISNVVFSFGAPRTVPIIFGFVLFIVVISSRYFILKLLVYMETLHHNHKRVAVAIYGAGMGGRQLISSLNKSLQFKPQFIIDDNKSFQNTIIEGLKVITPSDLRKSINKYKIEKIFLGIPSLSNRRRKEILASLDKFNCEVKELPSYAEFIASGGKLRNLLPVTHESLLGRNNVEFSFSEINNTYSDKNVLISGAGGSIGSQLCKQLVEIGPKKLVLFELSEYALYNIEMELRPLAEENGFELIAILGSVLNYKKLHSILHEHNIEIVFHAAAYKHVPLVEVNEIEAGRNNILGTKSLAEACVACGVERFIFISTDKAVRPTNVMGASKRFAELFIQGISQQEVPTTFSIVRFGNVLGSSGSVIPLFKKQIANGGPITLTHSKITRYFMTTAEAARLVFLAGTFAEGCEVFVLDMGKPIEIYELAKKMIELSGLEVLNEENPDGDIEIKITSLRPGEKLHEELFIGEDISTTPHVKIMKVREQSLSYNEISKMIEKASAAISENDAPKFRNILTECVEGYSNSQKEN